LHDVTSQMQAPFAQCWLDVQAGPLPQVHVPEAEHPSANATSHATQATPMVPHAARVCGWQVAPEQQPEGQDWALHPPLVQTPAEQAPPSGHA
jgi:hypothetical protein